MGANYNEIKKKCEEVHERLVCNGNYTNYIDDCIYG